VPIFAYVGSFTTKKRNARGEGIKVYRVGASGDWSHVQLVSSLVNPSFLAISHHHRTLYSVHADRAEVTAFSIERESGRLRLLNVRSIEASTCRMPDRRSIRRCCHGRDSIRKQSCRTGRPAAGRPGFSLSIGQPISFMRRTKGQTQLYHLKSMRRPGS
jgi:6-phosphogluconolactonase (cycloisomerase 2 family)